MSEPFHAQYSQSFAMGIARRRPGGQPRMPVSAVSDGGRTRDGYSGGRNPDGGRCTGGLGVAPRHLGRRGYRRRGTGLGELRQGAQLQVCRRQASRRRQRTGDRPQVPWRGTRLDRWRLELDRVVSGHRGDRPDALHALQLRHPRGDSSVTGARGGPRGGERGARLQQGHADQRRRAGQAIREGLRGRQVAPRRHSARGVHQGERGGVRF